MSIAVELDELRRNIAEIGTDPFLLTVGDDGRSHSVSVAVRWGGDELIVPAGRHTRTNADARPLVVLLWPPAQRGEFSLIVDATVTATTTGDAGENSVTVQPTSAVLHRPAASPDARRPGCTSDCVPILRT